MQLIWIAHLHIKLHYHFQGLLEVQRIVNTERTFLRAIPNDKQQDKEQAAGRQTYITLSHIIRILINLSCKAEVTDLHNVVVR